MAVQPAGGIRNARFRPRVWIFGSSVWDRFGAYLGFPAVSWRRRVVPVRGEAVVAPALAPKDGEDQILLAPLRVVERETCERRDLTDLRRSLEPSETGAGDDCLSGF